MPPSPAHEVYVSYAWKAPGSPTMAELLQEVCRRHGIELRRDSSQIGYGESIREYMQALGAGGAIVVLVSEDYLRSRDCMYELLEIEKHGHFRERVHPIVLESAGEFKFYEVADRLKVLKSWETRAKTLEAEIGGLGQLDHLSEAYRELDLCRDIRRDFLKLTGTLADMYSPRQDFHLETEFAAVIKRLLASVGPSILNDQRGKAKLPPVVDSFDPTLAKTIDTLLQPAPVAPLRRCLADRLGASPEAGLGSTLCRKDAMEALVAFRGAAHACRQGMPDDAWTGPLQTAARRILGWLLARFVRAERPADPLAVEIKVGTEVGAEVLWVHWLGGAEPPEFEVVGDRLMGKHNVLGRTGAAEAGWEGWAAYAQAAKLALWKAVLPWVPPPPGVFSPDENDQLAAALNLNRLSIGNDPHYATVDRGRVHEPLNDIEVLEALRQDIGLPILFVEATEEDLFAIPERHLRNTIAQCIDTIAGRRP